MHASMRESDMHKLVCHMRASNIYNMLYACITCISHAYDIYIMHMHHALYMWCVQHIYICICVAYACACVNTHIYVCMSHVCMCMCDMHIQYVYVSLACMHACVTYKYVTYICMLHACDAWICYIYDIYITHACACMTHIHIICISLACMHACVIHMSHACMRVSYTYHMHVHACNACNICITHAVACM